MPQLSTTDCCTPRCFLSGSETASDSAKVCEPESLLETLEGLSSLEECCEFELKNYAYPWSQTVHCSLRASYTYHMHDGSLEFLLHPIIFQFSLNPGELILQHPYFL
jgi:hypothetical protein